MAKHIQDPGNIASHHDPVLFTQFARVKGFDDFIPVQKSRNIRFGMDHLDIGKVHVINFLGLIGKEPFSLPH